MKCEVTATCNLLPPTRRLICIHSFIFYVDPSRERSRCCMIQYYFEGPVVDVMSKPHGLSKRSDPYYRTPKSSLLKMKQAVSDSTAKVAQQKLLVEQGLLDPLDLHLFLEINSNSVIFGEAQLYVTQMFFIQFCWNVNYLKELSMPSLGMLKLPLHLSVFCTMTGKSMR